MKNNFYLVLLAFAAIFTVSCSQKRFERVVSTENERYSIVYLNGKCGIYDNAADSLVTELVYDELLYGQTTTVDSLEFTVWGCEKEGCHGMLSIAGETNETTALMFP